MRIKALVVRILRQFIHDKRTMALMLIVPMLIMLLMSLVFNGAQYNPKIGVVNVPEEIVQQLREHGAIVTEYDGDKANEALESAKIDAIFAFEFFEPIVKLEGSDPGKTRSVLMLIQSIAQKMNPAAQTLKPTIMFLHGSANMADFDNFGPVLIGFFSFFFVFLIAGIAFLRERIGGTLERLLGTPLRRWEIVVGYVLGFGIFTVLQAILIAWFSISILKIMMVGSYLWVFLITILTAMTALTLGIFLSAFANNEFQMIQFIPLVIVPQVFFSGLFPMDTMAQWLRGIGYVMPLSYVADALRQIMIRGKGWQDIAVDVFVLLGLSVFFMIANVLALRKHRKI